MVQVDDIPPEHHALVPSYMGANSGGKRIHPLPFSDPAFPGNRNVLTSPISQLTYTQIYSPLSAGLKLNIYLVPFLQYNPDRWILPKTWLLMAMVVLLGRKGWKVGNKSKRNYR